jgi:hypothetical protein
VEGDGFFREHRVKRGSRVASNHWKLHAFSSTVDAGAAEPPLGVSVAAGAASTFEGPPEMVVVDEAAADETETGGEVWLVVASMSIPSIPFVVAEKGIESGMSEEGPVTPKSLLNVSLELA